MDIFGDWLTWAFLSAVFLAVDVVLFRRLYGTRSRRGPDRHVILGDEDDAAWIRDLTRARRAKHRLRVVGGRDPEWRAF